MSNKLRDLLVRVSNDKQLISAFDRVADLLDRSGLNADEQSAFLSRDSDRIRKMLGDEDGDVINMIFHWFKRGNRA